MVFVTLKYFSDISLGLGKYSENWWEISKALLTVMNALVLKLTSMMRSMIWISGGFCSVYLFPFYRVTGLNVSYCGL